MLETDARDRIIVAIDCDRERALELADSLSGHAAWLKVCLLYTSLHAEPLRRMPPRRVRPLALDHRVPGPRPG